MINMDELGENPAAAAASASHDADIDRCSLTALSINTALKRFPRIWSASSLPLDAFQLSAAPGGGALVLCQNLLLHHSQVWVLVKQHTLSCKPLLSCHAQTLL